MFKIVKNHRKINKQKRSVKIKFRLSNGHKGKELRLSDGKNIICKYLKKNVLRQLLFLEIVSVTKVKNKLFRCMCTKWWWGSN